ncbi:MAG: bifunctional riboflavin kinase/FAD synthetase [Actinomycetota bacterium]
MKVFTGDPTLWNPDGDRHAVAIGVFDGVHRGHLAVFRAVKQAHPDLPLAALTFGTHPTSVVTGSEPPALTSLQDRLELFAQAGVDTAAVIDFTDATRALSPADFIETHVVEGLNADAVAVGSGFRFGAGAKGTVDTLRLLGQNRGFVVIETPIVDLHGTEVRSSAIRAAVASGGVELAARMLGRRFAISGIVVAGDARGRTIGFPTANVTMPACLVRPAGGVYAVVCTVDGVTYPGVCNVGTRPTFGGGDEVIEVYLFDIDIDLYDKDMRVEFVDRIRNEQRFASVDALVSQIRTDVQQAKMVLGSAGASRY